MSNTRMVAWGIWFMAAIFYAYQYILRVMPNIMMNDITSQFGIDAAIFGQFSGIYYIGYSLMHLPIGLMLDRYGPKKVMPLCILLTVVGLLPLLFAEFWIYPLIGRLCIGIGSSAAVLGLFKIVRLFFSEERFTRMISLAVTIGLIGAIYGGGPVDYLLHQIGYQAVLMVFTLMGTTLALATYLLVPTIPLEKSSSVYSDIKAVISNKKVIFVCLLAGLMVGPLEGFADVWGTQFFKRVYGLEGTIAATLPSLIFIGMCFGAPLLSFAAEKTKNYLGTIAMAGVFMAACFFLLLTTTASISIVSILFIGVGVASAYQILAIYKASTYVSENLVSLATAAANMIIMLFGYVFHTVIGTLVNLLGGTMEKEAIFWGISVIPMALTVGAVGFFWLTLSERKAPVTVLE